MSVHQCLQRSQQIAQIHSNDGMDPIKLGRHDNSGVGSRFRITDFFYLFIYLNGENKHDTCRDENLSYGFLTIRSKSPPFPRGSLDKKGARWRFPRSNSCSSLSVHHLHCCVTTLQNIWSALNVSKLPIFHGKKITNQREGHLRPEGS